MNLHNVKFIKSAARPSDFIRDGLPQAVFAGKSNVGKSSVINAILGRRDFARVGSRPGKTIHINYFLIDGSAYFVDIPGYGYAEAPLSERKRWDSLMSQYFGSPDLIRLGILIVDSRRTPDASDAVMANLFENTGCPLIVVANKTDKLKKGEIEACAGRIRSALELPEDADVILFSAEKGINRDVLTAAIEKKIRS